jgi:hypothetical protein
MAASLISRATQQLFITALQKLAYSDLLRLRGSHITATGTCREPAFIRYQCM